MFSALEGGKIKILASLCINNSVVAPLLLFFIFCGTRWNFSKYHDCFYVWRFRIVKNSYPRKFTMQINILLAIMPKCGLVWDKEIAISWHFALFPIPNLPLLFKNLGFSVNSEFVCRFIQSKSCVWIVLISSIFKIL